MRARFAGLLAVAACNQVFGNHEVQHLPVDVIPGIDAAFGTMALTWMDVPAPNAAATPSAIVGAHVSVGSLTDLTDLQDRVIDPSTGMFTVPYDILQLSPRYRLVYTPADGIPVEIQTTLKTAHFVVPQIGRLDRTPWPPQMLPAGGHVDFVSAGWPTSYANLRFLGTGLWSNIEIGATSATFVNYSTFSTDSGLLGVPQSASGDQIIVTESPNATSGVTGYGILTFDGFEGSGLAHNEQYSAWKTTGVMKNLPVSSSESLISQFGGRASNLLNNGDPYIDDTIYGGVVATTDVQPFTDLVINGLEPGTKTGEYEKVVFATLSRNTSLNQVFLDPFTGAPAAPLFPTAVYQFGSSVHTFTSESVSVRSGVQEIILTDGSSPAIFDAGVGLASTIQFAPTGNPAAVIDLGTSADQVHVMRPAAGVATFELTFNVDKPAVSPTDCMATLYRIESTKLVAVSRYLVNVLPNTTLPILVDAKNIDSTHDYTFGISCYRGHKDAATGDWSTISFPFAVSRMWTHSFTAP